MDKSSYIRPLQLSRTRTLLVVVCFLLCARATSSEPPAPLEVIRSSNETILGLFARTELSTTHNQRDVFGVMERITDFAAIVSRATAPVCSPAEKPACQELRAEFLTLLKRSTITKLGGYRADRFEYIGEFIDGDTATVKTTAYFKDDSISLDYRLEKGETDWRIVNYIVDGVDTVHNYQKQFQRIVARQSLNGLLNRLKRKNEQYTKMQADAP